MQGVKNVIRTVAKKLLLVIGMLTAFAVFFACHGKDPEIESPTGTPTQEIVPTPAGNDAASEEITPTQEALPTQVDDPGITNEPVPTLMEDTDPDDDNDDDPVSVGGQDDPKPTDSKSNEGGEGKKDITEAPEDKAMAERRRADWEDTYLARIPEFTDGMYNGYTPEDTFDRAVFAGVKTEDVRKYITVLSDAGFIHNVETTDHAGEITYSASNENNWIVELEFSAGFVSIGSGYRVEDKSSPEYIAKIWMTTMLSNLPEFDAGVFGSEAPGSDGSHNIVFENVTAEDIRNYVAAVKEAGFTEEPDEGDSDGFIWYMAENADGIFCSITFYDGVVRIGCGN